MAHKLLRHPHQLFWDEKLNNLIKMRLSILFICLVKDIKPPIRDDDSESKLKKLGGKPSFCSSEDKLATYRVLIYQIIKWRVLIK